MNILHAVLPPGLLKRDQFPAPYSLRQWDQKQFVKNYIESHRHKDTDKDHLSPPDLSFPCFLMALMPIIAVQMSMPTDRENGKKPASGPLTPHRKPSLMESTRASTPTTNKNAATKISAFRIVPPLLADTD